MIKAKEELTGHFFALFTVLIWGITFISTKVLLKALTPVEILIYRFILGYAALWIVFPHKVKLNGAKDEIPFLLAGLLGTTLYQFMENTALTFTQASNVSIIIACVPFFTGIIARLVYGDKIKKSFIAGFLISITGVILINVNGSVILKLNPLGDLFALMAAMFWAMYTIIVNFIHKKNINILGATRRIFFYGVLCTIPVAVLGDFSFSSLAAFKDLGVIGNIAFLGIGASAICFVTWNTAIKKIGSVKTSMYNYLNPVVTLIFSIIILDEKIGVLGFIGIAAVLSGLIISEYMGNMKIKEGNEENGILSKGN